MLNLAERMEYVFTQMEDAICITGMNGQLCYTNASAEALFGIRHGDNRKLWEIIPFVEANDELIQMFIDGVMNKQKSIRSLVDFTNHEGKTFRLHVSLTCEDDPDGVIMVVLTDLTDLQKVRTAFTRYTSPAIADFVLDTPEGARAGGKTREVTILMSDLRGFTMLSSRMSSGDMIAMVNHYFEAMTAIIERFRGTVIEFLGDGLFVVFGAPEDLPGHAEAAVRCAVEMQNAMDGVNEWNRDQGYPKLKMGIGINSGLVTVGNIGSEKKMKYGCIGEAVNLTGRLESFSIGGQIYISERTRTMIRQKLTIEGQRSFLPKGGSAEMTIYDISGIGDLRVARPARAGIRWLPLERNKELPFFELSDKTVDKVRHTGRLTKISEDEQYGLLVTGSALEPMKDLMIVAGNESVYAKVLEHEGDQYKVSFTSAPGKLAELFRNT